MTEFKPGNRVQWRDKDGILHRGTVDDVYDDCVYGTRDAGGRFVAGPWDLTKITDPPPLRFEDVRTFASQSDGSSWRTNYNLIRAALTDHTPAEPKITAPAPLRFEDVRDGDTITVEGIDYSITGTASKPDNPACVTVGGVTVFNFDGDEGTHGPYGPPVRLTAHTRALAEPEWHRAKVIKADRVVREGDLPGYTGGYLIRAYDGNFLNEYVSLFAPSELTNVTIIVDAEGVVRG